MNEDQHSRRTRGDAPQRERLLRTSAYLYEFLDGRGVRHNDSAGWAQALPIDQWSRVIDAGAGPPYTG